MESRLCYRDRYVRSLLGSIPQDTTNDTVNNELYLPPEETNYLVLELTGNEYTEMFSALMQGSELIYPEKSQELLWLFWRAAKTMTFCNAVELCIETNPEIRELIDEIINDNGDGTGNPDAPLSPEILGEEWLQGNCDDDKLWGSCEYVIDGIFDSTLEVLQRISLATEPLQAVGELTELLPIAGKIVGIGVTLIDWITDTALALFQTVDSPVVREELACELFCLCKQTCTISMLEVEQAFRNNLTEEPPILGGVKEQLEWLTGLILSGNPNLQIAATINMLGVFVMLYGGKFGSSLFSLRSVGQLAELGAVNNANNNWTIVCNTCDVFCDPVNQNYENGVLANETIVRGAILDNAQIAHSPTHALQGTIEGTVMWVQTKFTFATPCKPNNVKWWFKCKHDAPNQVVVTYTAYYDELDNLIGVLNEQVPGGDGVYTQASLFPNYDNVKSIMITCGVSTGSTKYYVFIDDIEIT